MTPITKPKRPLSAYNLFFRAERLKLLDTDPPSPEATVNGKTERRRHRKTHGKIGFQDLTRHIAREWKALDDGQRAVWEEQAVVNLKKYYEEMEAFKEATRQLEAQQAIKDGQVSLFSTMPSASKNGQGHQRQTYAPALPKHSLPHMRNAHNSHFNMTVLNKQNGSKSMSSMQVNGCGKNTLVPVLSGTPHEAQRLPDILGSVADAAMGVVIQQHMAGPKKKSVGVPPQMPRPKRPLSAYNLFFRHERANVIGCDIPEPKKEGEEKKKRRHRKTHGLIGFKDLAKLIASRWRSLDLKQKALFEDQAAENLRVYWQQMEVYKKAWSTYEVQQGNGYKPDFRPSPRVPSAQKNKLKQRKLSSQPKPTPALKPPTYGLDLLTSVLEA